MSSLGKAVKDMFAAGWDWDDGEELDERDKLLT